MAETDLDTLTAPPARRLHFEWLLPLLVRPRRTLAQILAVDGRTWQAPLLVLTLLVILTVAAAGPARQAALSVPTELPQDFQYYSPEQQAQYQQGLAAQASFFSIYGLPVLGALVSLWLSWFLLGSLLHLSLTLAGSRSSSAAAMNLAGWASLPLGVRSLVQGLAALFTHQVVAHPGLSGFFTPGAGRLQTGLSELFARVDLYLIWQIVLILLGTTLISGLPRKKGWAAALFAVLIILVLQAVPGFLVWQLRGLSLGGM